MGTEKNNSNKFIRGIITTLFSLIIIYSILFINNINVYAKTSDKNLSSDEYVLTLIERGGITEEIKGTDIGLQYNSKDTLKITYNEDLLRKRIDTLTCFNASNLIEPKNASFQYKADSYSYVLVEEILGNKVKKDVLYNKVVNSILKEETSLDLEAAECYENPKYVANSPIVTYAIDTINKYLRTNIAYDYAGIIQILDSSTITNWVWIDENFQVRIDEGKVKSYVDNLANSYTSSLGSTIKIGGGYSGNNHGWTINTTEETKALIENIKCGQTLIKHPIYSKTSVAGYFNNVSDTFVEINMSKQHLWFYKNGYLIVDGDIVTGNVSGGNATPAGIYKLYYKQKDTVLRGPGYASPVNFWMPFNGGIGLHDANWRSEFGGEIYLKNGSHGCINLPYNVAKSIYDNINKGVTIICYN